MRFLLRVTADELPAACDFAKKEGLPVLPLGEGSNVLAPDEGLNAIAVKILSDELSFKQDGEHIMLTVGAGYSWDLLVEKTVQNGWWGIENLTSIPGTVGAAVVQNIGAYGAALEESFVSAEAYDIEKRDRVVFTKNDVTFGYRTSLFKRDADRYIITSVTLRLSLSPKPNIRYRDLTSHFAESEEEPTIGNIRRAVSSIRAKKFPPLSAYGTAGSFFLNPVLSAKEASHIQGAFPGMPLFPMPEGGVKVPLAWIFDRALALKGMRVDSAFLWPAQPLVIAADKNATTNAVIELADRVRSLAEEKTELHIVPEVRILSREKKFFHSSQKKK